MDGINIREKTLHTTIPFGIDNSMISSGWTNLCKRKIKTVYRNLAGESQNVDSERAGDWKND
jgi:hypothetical protein